MMGGVGVRCSLRATGEEEDDDIDNLSSIAELLMGVKLCKHGNRGAPPRFTCPAATTSRPMVGCLTSSVLFSATGGEASAPLLAADRWVSLRIPSHRSMTH